MTVSTDDPALDEALVRISDLAGRLWAVRQAHRPVTGRPPRARVGLGWTGLRGRRGARCGGCGQAFPCLTLRAAG